MPSPKSGSAGSIVAPAEPTEIFHADSADPGEVAEAKAKQIENKEGKYGSSKVKPFKPKPEEAAEKKDGWIEVELEDDEGNPVAGEKYEITMPDGSVATGTTDQKGVARVEGFDPGQCQISFPDQEDD